MNYFNHTDDRKLLVQAIKITRKIMKSDPISNDIIEEHSPGNEIQSDAQIEQFLATKGGSVIIPLGLARWC